jgi:ribonuclease J
MNIITQKDVFSDENMTSTPKRRGRPRKNTLASTIADNNKKPASPVPYQSEQPLVHQPRPITSSPAPQNETTPSTDEGPKTVFYQAAKPRQNPIFNRRPALRPLNPNKQLGPNPTGPLSGSMTGPVVRPTFPQNALSWPSQTPSTPTTNPLRRPSHGYTTPPSGFTNSRGRGHGALPPDGTATFMPSANMRRQVEGPSHNMYPFRANTQTKLRIIPLGGLEEIGKNMTAFEYGNDILIIDMGFMFPDYDMFGVDYIIPDVSYLQDKKDRIRGVIITHGHLDHTGAVPYIIEKLGFPPIYGTQITIGMVKQRLEEFGLVGRNKLINIEADKDVLQLGVFRVFPFHLTHSIPGAVGLEIETPNGRIVYATDWKFDYTPADGQPVDFQILAGIGGRGVDLLFSDSTNAERPGHSISEKVVEQSLSAAIEEAKGRVIIAMFATNLSRIQQTLNAASKNGRKVLVVGRSMQQNIEMAVNLKAIILPPHTLISEREANRFNDNQILVLSTGAQGEDRSALVRMASGEHRNIKIKKGDTVIISASPIPGNEKSVSSVMDILYKAGANVIYNKVLDVHTSGHANQEDLKLFIALMKPKYFMPLHGERSKLIQHARLAEEVGVAPENILIGENGGIVEVSPDHKVSLSEEKVPAGMVMVDGLGVGDVGNIVLRDRQAMAQDGIFVAITVFDGKSKKFLTSPDIISRGFIYMRENEQFINDVRNEIKHFLQKSVEGKHFDLNQIKNELRDHVSKLLYEKTERTPMVIPVIIEV